MTVPTSTLRYGIVSGVCFVLGATLIPFFDWLGLHYAAATLVAFVLIAIVGFILHCQWTFEVERSLAGFVRYVSAMLLNLPLTVILIGIGHDLIGFSVLLAAPLASTLLLVWNYLAVRWAIAGKRKGNRT